MIVRALASMLSTQAVVVAASLAAPVLAPLIAAEGFESGHIGYYSSLVFASAAVSAVVAADLVARHGPVRLSQATALLAAAGLVALASGTVAGIVLSAVALGLAYGPGNPASSALLARVVPAGRRAVVFSLKQTAVPLGGVIAGSGLTALAAALGWQAAVLAAAGLAVAAALAVEPWRAGLDAAVPSPPGAGLLSPLRLVLAHPALRRLGLAAACLASVQFATGAIFVTFLVESAGARLAVAGAALSAAMAASVALRIGLGFVADRRGGRRVLTGLSAVMLAAALALAAGGTGWAVVDLGVATVLAAAAYSWNGVYLSEVAAAAPPDRVARATGGTMVCVFLGGFAGPAAFTLAAGAAGSLADGFWVLAALAALGCGALLAGAPVQDPAAP